MCDNAIKRTTIPEIFAMSPEYNWDNLGSPQEGGEWRSGYNYHPITRGKMTRLND